jgi:hypothetical protein
MATPAELYTQLQKLKTVTIQTGRAAIRNINPLTEVEALDTNLRLITGQKNSVAQPSLFLRANVITANVMTANAVLKFRSVSFPRIY